MHVDGEDAMNRCARRLLSWAALVAGLASPVSAALTAELFRDDFDIEGPKLGLDKWTTEIGPSSFLGRTQLQDWVTPSGIGRFDVIGGEAHLALNTFNPTGFSLYGTHGKTRDSFVPSAGVDLELAVRMRLTTLQPGLVFGIYFFGCDPAKCASDHDELDIEIVTNFLQPSAFPLQVQLNRYAAEPLGAGQGPVVYLPASFDPLAYHEWKIVWGQGRAIYLVDGMTLFSATDHVPQRPMQANVIAWGPAPEWPDAYDASLQPVSSAGLDQSFVARIDYVSVTAVPEPAEWVMMVGGLLLIGAWSRRMPRRAST